MNRILIVGCGDLAMRVARLLGARYQLFGLVRNPLQMLKLREAGIVPILGDLDKPHSLQRLGGLPHIVLHFAPPADSEGKFSNADLRTRNLIQALSRGQLPCRLIYISTSGVYGDCNGEIVSETRTTHAQNSRAKRRRNAEIQLQNWAKRRGVRACILRVPGIYAADRLPLERIKKTIPAIIASEDTYTNHIHADDLARCVQAALRHAKPNRIYHTSDDHHMKMGDYFDAVADAFHLPRPPRVTRAEAQKVLSPQRLSFINESRRLSNTRMKQELKVKLRYPTVVQALAEIKPPGFAELTAPTSALPRHSQLPLPLF